MGENYLGYSVRKLTWLTQLSQPTITFPTLDLAAHPQLAGIDQQSVQAGTYDLLLGGG